MQNTAVKDGTGSPHQLLERLNIEYVRAVATGDAAWFEQHLSEDFLNSCPDGSIVDKAAFIGQINRPSVITGLAADDVKIRIMGSTAIVHAVTRYHKASGEPATGRYTDVWILRNGRWECVAAHVTRG